MSKINVIQVVDTETTGLGREGEEKPRVVEVASVNVVLGKRGWAIGVPITSLVNPGIPIPPESRAVHHISDEDVSDAPTFESALKKMDALLPDVRAAHNAEYDAQFFPEGKWICTYRCAKHVWPDLPSHGNQTIRYSIPGLNEKIINGTKAARAMALPPHRALPDAWVTAHILLELLALRSPLELIELTAAPILLKTVRFGKHRGMEWSAVPRDYLSWILRQEAAKPGDFDRDTVHTANHYWKR